MLRPLPPGEHTLRIKGRFRAEKGENVEDRFWLDLTYELTQ